MDIDIIKLYLKLNLLDVLFKQHINTKMILDISCILLGYLRLLYMEYMDPNL